MRAYSKYTIETWQTEFGRLGKLSLRGNASIILKGQIESRWHMKGGRDSWQVEKGTGRCSRKRKQYLQSPYMVRNGVYNIKGTESHLAQQAYKEYSWSLQEVKRPYLYFTITLFCGK